MLSLVRKPCSRRVWPVLLERPALPFQATRLSTAGRTHKSPRTSLLYVRVRACVNYRHLETRPVATPTLPGDRFAARWAQTEAGSWFLGSWTADGYLSRDASMSLALKDHGGIQLAAKALGLKQERVGLHRQLGQARIRVGVKWFLPRLAVLGITPGPKTGRERAPLGLEHNRYFWRGVVDGDGWMSPERRVIGLVTASPLLRDQFSEFLDETVGSLPTTSVCNNGTLYRLSLTDRTRLPAPGSRSTRGCTRNACRGSRSVCSRP